MMMSALAAALGVSGQTETLISRNQRSGAQAQAAAEAGLNHAVELTTTYIFEWQANDPGGWVGPEDAIDALLKGPDGLSGTVGTDADNGSLGTRAGIAAAEDIPLGTRLTIAAGINAEYEARVMDDAGVLLGEEVLDDPLNDANETVIVRATGYAQDGTTVVLEALISPIPLPALITNGDLDITGSVAISGAEGDVHSNGDLTISGGAATVSGTVTASGDYTGTLPGSGGAAPLPLPAVRASDYLHYADFILTSGGTMTNQAGTVLCIWTMVTPCNVGWDFDSGTGAWSISSTAPTGGTYYVEGRVNITGSPGSAATPVLLTLIAEGSIDISGSPDITADTPELLFVTDGDLQISGGLDALDPLTVGGQMLVHEQVQLSGNPSLAGQLIVENAPSVDPLVEFNQISGNVTITYNGGLGSGVYSVTGWREIR
jgi:hypothetical protein